MAHVSRRLAGLILATSGFASPAAAQDLGELQARGTLRVAVQPDSHAERFSREPDGPPGFDKEILLGFAALHRLKLEVVPIQTQDAILALLSGDVDVIAQMTFTDARRKLVDFTSAVLPACHLTLTRRPDAPVLTLERLRASRVATMAGSSWEEATRAAGVPPSRVEGFATGNEVLEAVARGRVPVAVISAVWAILAQKNDAAFEVGTFVGERTGVGYATRKGSAQLLGALDSYIGNVRRSGTWNRLVVKYFGDRSLPVLKLCEAVE